MWRALFLAIGISMCIIGAESLVIHEVVLASEATEDDGSVNITRTPVKPAEYMPWTLIASGVVVLLYSSSIPRRFAGE